MPEETDARTALGIPDSPFLAWLAFIIESTLWNPLLPVAMQSPNTDDPKPLVAHVDLYSERFSADCMNAKAILDHKGVAYSEFVIDNDPESRQVMLQRAGARSRAPQVFINGRGIGGWKQLQALDVAGELDALLAEKPHNLVADERARANRDAGQKENPRKGFLSRLMGS